MSGAFDDLHQTIAPVSWLATEVHDGKDQNAAIVLKGVVDTQGKPMKDVAADVLLDGLPCAGMIADEADSPLNLRNEGFSQFPVYVGLVGRCLGVLAQSLRVEPETRHFARRLTRTRPSSPGTGSTLPDRISSLRLLAVARWTCSISGSMWETMLAISLSTRSALDSLGSAIASVQIASTVMGMTIKLL